MGEFFLFCVPTVIYLVTQSRGEDRSFRTARHHAGLSWGAPGGYGWAISLLLPLVLTGWLAIALVPSEVLELPGVSIAQVTSVSVASGVVLRAVGEEVLFRGLLGGVLIRKVGFGWGSLLQASVFLVPHLALLLVDVRMAPILPVQFAAGWALGWLRHRAGSFVPGAVVHALANLGAGLLTA